jgi:membrane protein involved in colicin uptake
LPLYEAYYDDDNPRKAIEVARRYADGKADVEELAAARAAAWEAAWEAARDVAGDAALAAAGAARAAARDAARDVAWDAARAAARAARAAAGAAERNWQVERLGEILELAYRERNVGEDDRPGGGECWEWFNDR